MKRFRTKKKIDKKILIVGFILFLIIFAFISFCKLNNSNERIINLVFKDLNINKDNKKTFNLTSNLDYLIKSFNFIKKDNVTYNDTLKIHLNNPNNNSKIDEVIKVLQDNLKKLGILSFDNDSNSNDVYHIDLGLNNEKETIEFSKKKYALFSLTTNRENESIVNKMKEYLDNNYKGLLRGIKKDDGVKNITITLDNVNNFQNVNNSTEIIALVLYHVLGDIDEERT